VNKSMNTSPHITKLLNELENIANANWREWGIPNATAADFVIWAKSRASQAVNEVKSEIALAEQQEVTAFAKQRRGMGFDEAQGKPPQQESEYITAVQAQELGAGNAEFQYDGGEWKVCSKWCVYNDNEDWKYRAIKQAQAEHPENRYVRQSNELDCPACGGSGHKDDVKAQPEPVGVHLSTNPENAKLVYAEPVDPDDVRIELVVALNSLASDFEIATYSMKKGSEDRVKAEGAIAHAMKIHAKHNQNGRIFTNETAPVDPHADLRAEYAKQVEEGTTWFYLWELQNCKGEWLNIGCRSWATDVAYRYTDISCYVSKDGEPAIRMLRTEAQELQRQTKDTHDWFTTGGALVVIDLLFGDKGTYTYRTKATIMLGGNMVTPAQAAAEWEAKKDTHDAWYKSNQTNGFEKRKKVHFDLHSATGKPEYELRPKQPIWTGSREDVIALLKELELL